MKYNNTSKRRGFIRRMSGLLTVFFGGTMLAHNCTPPTKKEEQTATHTTANPCQDLSDVSEEELKKRENLGYVDTSPIDDNQCNNCNLYLPPGNKPCGACMLFKGPVESEGYCTYWAPKV